MALPAFSFLFRNGGRRRAGGCAPCAPFLEKGCKKCGALKAPHGSLYSAVLWLPFCRLRRRASMRMNSFTSSMSSAERASLASA